MAGIRKFTPTSNHLVIAFETKEQADYFKSWMCGIGEQDFWDYAQECREESNSLSFDYHEHPNAIAAYYYDEEKYTYDPKKKTPECYQRVKDKAKKLAEIITKRSNNDR
jgi:hypothetical protein